MPALLAVPAGSSRLLLCRMILLFCLPFQSYALLRLIAIDAITPRRLILRRYYRCHIDTPFSPAEGALHATASIKAYADTPLADAASCWPAITHYTLIRLAITPLRFHSRLLLSYYCRHYHWYVVAQQKKAPKAY